MVCYAWKHNFFLTFYVKIILSHTSIMISVQFSLQWMDAINTISFYNTASLLK